MESGIQAQQQSSILMNQKAQKLSFCGVKQERVTDLYSCEGCFRECVVDR